MVVQLGLCCLNTELRAKKPNGVFCSRKPIMATIKTKGLPYLQEICRQNCRDLITMLKWNAAKGIRVFRLSSELFPHKSNPRVISYTLDFAQDLLTEAGQIARESGQRLTFHPGPYNIVGSHNTDRVLSWAVDLVLRKDDITSWNGILWRVKIDHTATAEAPCDLPDPVLYERCTFQRTIDDLSWQAETLDRLNCDQHSVMVVHGGALYGDKVRTKARWITNFALLPEPVRKRLVLENCEKCFNIEDCLDVSRACGVPVVFDTHHYTCYNQLHPQERLKPEVDYLPDILASWARRGIKPKFHVSNQACCGPVGKHSDYIEEIPAFLLNLTVDIDIMIEAKQKELAIARLYERHPELAPVIPADRKRKSEEM